MNTFEEAEKKYAHIKECEHCGKSDLSREKVFKGYAPTIQGNKPVYYYVIMCKGCKRELLFQGIE